MRKLRVKICGITTQETLRASHKADFIGFVFYPKSPRFLTTEEAKKLCENCRKGQKKVGLFVNSDHNLISFINDELSLDYIQLHGDETIEEIQILKKKIGNTKIIKSVGISKKKDLQKSYNYENIVDMILLDTKYKDEIMPGGNGVAFDWSILKDLKLKKEWMLAGGINYFNLKNSVELTKAPIVDISSGLEVKKGKKTSKKIIEFLDLAGSLK